MFMLMELWAVKGNLRAAFLCHKGIWCSRAFTGAATASSSDKEATAA